MSSAALAEPVGASLQPQGLVRFALRRFARNPVAVAALVVVVATFVAGALAPVVAPLGWNSINLAPNAVHQAPSIGHPFGTDVIGRDMVVRTLYGIRTSEEVALGAAALATILGVLAGLLAGYYGSWVDAVVMRLADLVSAYPVVVLTLAALLYLNEAYPQDLVLIFGACMWAVVARVVRAQAFSLRGAEFVEAARALGGSDLRILLRHVLPSTAGTILVAATSLVGQIVLIDATVEFFNYGLSSSVAPSLGNLIADIVQFKFGLSQEPITAAYGWWTWVFPSLVLALILVGLNLVGDALDAALNPAAA